MLRRVLLIAAVPFTAISSVRAAQAQAPVDHFRALLDAYNSGSGDSIARLAQERFAAPLLERLGGPAGAAAYLMDKYAAYGPLQLDTVARSSADDALIWTRGSLSRTWIGFTVRGGEKLTGLGTLEGIRPPFALMRSRSSIPSL